MISNEMPSSRIYQWPESNKPPVQETTHKTGQVEIERKTITITLKENHQGRFVRITEESAGHRNSIIVPASGLAAFQKLLDETAQAAKALH